MGLEWSGGNRPRKKSPEYITELPLAAAAAEVKPEPTEMTVIPVYEEGYTSSIVPPLPIQQKNPNNEPAFRRRQEELRWQRERNSQ